MKRLVSLLLSLAITSPAVARKQDLTQPGVAFPADFPPVAREKVLAALRHPDCKFVGGQAVNWITTLKYQGNTSELNAMLRALQESGAVELKITQQTNAFPEGIDWTILHMGRSPEFTFYLNPDSKNIDVDRLDFPLFEPESSVSALPGSKSLKTYAPEGNRWSFVLPEEAKMVVRSEVHDGSDQPVTVTLHCFDQPGVRCQLRQFELPDSETDTGTLELLGRYCLSPWGNPTNVTQGPTVKQHGIEGNEYLVAGENPVRLRVFRSDGRVFVVSAATAADLRPGALEAGTAFLNSFRLGPAASPEKE